MKRKQDIINSLLILIIIIAAHFQLIFKIFYTKWDNLSAFFPYRYTANHFWRAGELPLWDPYQNLGYPMHANPQGYVWYPLTQLFALFGEYSPYFMNLELVLHIFIAALGIYFLFKYLNIINYASLLGAVSFGLSGFITGSSHMIGFTIAAAWLPWVLLYFFKCLRSLDTKNFIILAILGMFQITGSYVAFSIILVYVLFGILTYALIRKQIQNAAPKILRLCLISVPLFLILSSPFLYSIYDSLPYFSRATPLSYDLDNFNRNFSYECFQSLLFPYINSSAKGFENVDVSLANIYVGFLMILSTLTYLIYTKDKNKYALFSCLTLFSLLALGTNTPIHQFFFNLLPGISLFRHPYLYQLYSSIILIYFGCTFLSNHTAVSQKQFKNVLKIGILFLVIIVVASLLKSDLSDFQNYVDHWRTLKEQSPLNKWSHVAIQGTIVTLIYLVVVLTKKHTIRIMSYVIIMDLIIAVQLNAPLNMYYNVPSVNIDQHLSRISNQSLTNQNIDTPIDILSNDNIPKTAGLCVNLNTFTRTTGIDGYNPFIFKTLDSISKTERRDSIAPFALVKPKGATSNLHLGLNTIEFDIIDRTNGACVVQQNYHHNWTASINDNVIDIYPNKYGLIAFDSHNIPGRVRLVYSNTIVRNLFYISTLILFAITISLVALYVIGTYRRLTNIPGHTQ